MNHGVLYVCQPVIKDLKTKSQRGIGCCSNGDILKSIALSFLQDKLN